MNKFPVRIDRKRDSRAVITFTAVLILTVFIAFLLFFNVFYTRIYVVGYSMQNTLSGAPSVQEAGGDYVYICKYISPQRGDIVVIDAGEISLIKRVIAFGGDSLKMEDGRLYLKKSGETSFKYIEEPYVSPENKNDAAKNNFGEVRVKQGYVFFMGDNRDNSEDSRGSYYGMLPEERITGVVTGWSMQWKDAITSLNTFFEFTLPGLFRGR